MHIGKYFLNECEEECLEEIIDDKEDIECGRIKDIVDEFISKEKGRGEGLTPEKILVCRLDVSAYKHPKLKPCCFDISKATSLFDLFILITKRRKSKGYCLHVECKRVKSRNKSLYKLVGELERKKRGYPYSSECFCFNAHAKTVGVIIIRKRSRMESKDRITQDICNKIRFDYIFIF